MQLLAAATSASHAQSGSTQSGSTQPGQHAAWQQGDGHSSWSPVRDLAFHLLQGKGVYSDIADSQVGGGKDDWLKGMQALLKARQMVALLSQAC